MKCETCDRPIGKARMKALPHTKTCKRHSTEQKKKHIDVDHAAKADITCEPIRPAYSVSMRRYR